MTLLMIESQTYNFDPFFAQLYHFFNDIFSGINSSSMSKNLVLLIDGKLNNDPFGNNIFWNMIQKL